MPSLPQRIDNALNLAGKAMSLVDRILVRFGDPKKRATTLRTRAVNQRKMATRARTKRAVDRHLGNAKALDERADLLDPPAPVVCVDA